MSSEYVADFASQQAADFVGIHTGHHVGQVSTGTKG